MKNKILKRTFALGCLTLALFCVVKKEEENKKPIIMKQLAVAEEVIERDAEDGITFEIQSEDEETEDDDTLQTDGEELTEELPSQEILPEETADVVEYETGEELSILVVGSAKTSVAPDSAVIYARIETLENDIDASKENNLAIFDTVVTALGDKGIEKENIKLECFNCSPCYEFSLSKSITGYCTVACLSVEIPSIDSLEDYITVLTDNGVCCINNISYQVSNMEEQYNIALSQAVANARTKAEKMSGQEGLNLVKIKEEVVCSPLSLARKCSDDVKLSDYVGNVDIEARVIAVFEK